MLKKIAFYIFIVLSVCAATWAYIKLKQKKQPSVSVINHIPNDAFCIIECKNYSEFSTLLIHQNLIWNKLLSNEDIAITQKNLQFLDSLINLHEELKEIFDNNSIYWSFIKTLQTTEHLIQFKLKEKDDELFFNGFFQNTFQKDNTIESFQVYTYKTDKQNWLITIEDGIVYIASNSIQLQKAISLDDKESIASNKNYVELIKMNGNQPMHLYFNHQLHSLFSKNILSQNSCFNIDVQINQMNLNGYSIIDSTSFLNVLKNQEASKMTLFEQLPNNPAFMKGLTVSDSKLFFQQLETYHLNQFSIDNSKLWNSLNDSALYSIKNEFIENLESEIVNASYVINQQVHELTMFQLKDVEKVKPLIKLLADSSIKTGSLEKIKLKQKYSSMLSVFNPLTSYQYAFVKDNLLVLATSEQMAKTFQMSITNTDIIEKNNHFMSYANDNLLQEGNYLYYENLDLIRENNLASFFQSNELIHAEKAISNVSLIAKNYMKYMQVRINATHSNNQSSDSSNNNNTLWTFSADTALKTPIFVFTNHITKEKELCFQDENNQLYLISSTGNVMWKKPLDESIKSSIYTVDIFKNEKYQLFFNTENHLHLIDRNGKEVDGYPKKMPSRITSNITLLDYDNTKDYRVFIACADKKIYNFSIFGVKTDGFIPVVTEAHVELPINYVKLGQSDYLIAVDVMGKVYAFSRKGLGRIDFNNRTILNPSNLHVSVGNQLSNTKLIYVDDLDNTLNKISFSDTKQSMKLGDELTGFKTRFDLIDEDTQQDILMYGDGAVYGYDLFSNKLIEVFDSKAFYEDVQMVSTSSDNFILAFDKVGQKIDLYTTEGKFIKSVNSISKKPLVAQLYNNNKYYLISTNNNQVNCTKLD